MKMRFTPVVILMFFLLSASAQSPISLTSADMPANGFSETFAVDTPLTSVNYGNPGANQVYDFSALTNTHPLTISYVAASTIPQHTSFPTANQALQSNGSDVYLNSNASNYTAVGLQGMAYGSLALTPISPAEVLYEFPTQYQSNYHSNWGFYQAFTGNQVGQSSVDSVREIYTDHFSSVVDGWGKVITPVGSYRGLRIKQVDTINIEVDAYYTILFGSPSWHNVTSGTYYVTEYSYVSKETKGALVSFSYDDTTGLIHDAQYSLIPPAPPIAGFSSVNGSAGLVTFTDTSEGFPTRYHWIFGDGDTSNVADPNHTYAANGTYYVCETVYNPSGSNTICDSVHITNIIIHVPPVAVNDTATVHQPNYDTLAVTANDHSPSGDAFCVTSVYGGSYFAVLGCNDVTFTPPSNFTGYDSCHYIICNTNQPTLCDTALVVIDVIAAAIHLPPVAVNDFSTDLENNKDTIDVTANDHSPSGDAFCVTRVYGNADFTVLGCNDVVFTPANNFLGYDTVWYVVCNTVQTTLCDTARVIVEVVAAHVPPVAVNDTLTGLQGNRYLIDATVNDYSPSNDSFCIHAIYGSADFSILSCNNVLFTPDSTFTGNDTAWYVICNTAAGQTSLCDTAEIIVTVDPNPALLPVTNFSVHQVMCAGIVGINSTSNADSLVWEYKSLNFNPIDSFFIQKDTVECGYFSNDQFQVCLTAYNKFGSASKCDTIDAFCDGINEVQLSGISIYPNPASSQLSIDMRSNTEETTKDYTAIELYNAIGQKIKTINRTSGADVINVEVSGFASGIYLATIVDSKGARYTLGKFTVMQ
jgi:PKD repeat protein